MKINIYYGGRGLLDDPTLYVISRIENVLKELRVKVERYNSYIATDLQRCRWNHSRNDG